MSSYLNKSVNWSEEARAYVDAVWGRFHQESTGDGVVDSRLLQTILEMEDRDVDEAIGLLESLLARGDEFPEIIEEKIKMEIQKLKVQPVTGSKLDAGVQRKYVGLIQSRFVGKSLDGLEEHIVRTTEQREPEVARRLLRQLLELDPSEAFEAYLMGILQALPDAVSHPDEPVGARPHRTPNSSRFRYDPATDGLSNARRREKAMHSFADCAAQLHLRTKVLEERLGY